MSIYRGAGGSGDALADSSSEALLIRSLVSEADADAVAAATSATNAANSATNAAASAASINLSSIAITGGSINNTTIGATTPSTGVFTTLNASGVATFSAGTVSLPAITTTGDTNTGIFFPAADTIAFTEGGVEAARFDSSGNLLVGTTTASGKITIGGTGANRIAFIAPTTTNFVGYDGSADVLQVATGTSVVFQAGSGYPERMRIDSSGNVGIGLNNPNGQLHQYLASGTTSRFNQNGSVVIDEFASTTVSAASYGTSSNHNLSIKTNNLERILITAAGNISIGNAPSAADKLNLYYDRSSQQCITIFPSADTGSGNAVLFVNAASSGVGSIATTSTATSYNSSSDYRLKESIAPMIGALDTVAQLKPVTYKWKSDGSNGQGFIAHELQAVVPECVTGEKDAVDADNSPIYQGIDTSFLVATLTAAIQELKTTVDAQAARIAALENPPVES